MALEKKMSDLKEIRQEMGTWRVTVGLKPGNPWGNSGRPSTLQTDTNKHLLR